MNPSQDPVPVTPNPPTIGDPPQAPDVYRLRHLLILAVGPFYFSLAVLPRHFSRDARRPLVAYSAGHVRISLLVVGWGRKVEP